jgi:hypothetical protein
MSKTKQAGRRNLPLIRLMFGAGLRVVGVGHASILRILWNRQAKKAFRDQGGRESDFLCGARVSWSG